MAKNDFPDPKLYFAVACLMGHNCSNVKHTKLSYLAAKLRFSIRTGNSALSKLFSGKS